MSEEQELKVNGEDQAEPVALPAGVKAEITITLFNDGNLQVNGPFPDRMTMEAMMALGLEAIHEQYRQARAPKVHKASFYDRHVLEKLNKGR